MICQLHYSARKSLGFTLIELLTTLSITAILFTFAIPSFRHLTLSSQAKTSIKHITDHVRLARNIAVTHSIPSTLCPSTDGLMCSTSSKNSRSSNGNDNWQDGVLLFTDKNSNNIVDSADQIIRFQKPFLEQGSLKWTSLRNYIQFSSRGFPRGTIGSFVYCPDNKDNTFSKSVSLSFQGKLRQGRDLDGDGIVESGNHKNIVCT